MYLLYLSVVPYLYRSTSRYFGQNLLLHDCLHRSRGRTDFTVFSDLDEHIVPGQVKGGEVVDSDLVHRML